MCGGSEVRSGERGLLDSIGVAPRRRSEDRCWVASFGESGPGRGESVSLALLADDNGPSGRVPSGAHGPAGEFAWCSGLLPNVPGTSLARDCLLRSLG